MAVYNGFSDHLAVGYGFRVFLSRGIKEVSDDIRYVPFLKNNRRTG